MPLPTWTRHPYIGSKKLICLLSRNTVFLSMKILISINLSRFFLCLNFHFWIDQVQYSGLSLTRYIQILDCKTLIDTYFLQIRNRERERERERQLGINGEGCRNSLQQHGHFAWCWAHLWTDMRVFMLQHSLLFILHKTCKWQSRADTAYA